MIAIESICNIVLVINIYINIRLDIIIITLTISKCK